MFFSFRFKVIKQDLDGPDFRLYEKAMADFIADPVTYTLDEVESELGLKRECAKNSAMISF